MPSVWVPRKQIENGSLPPVCIVCGAKARERRFPGLGAPSLAWLIVNPLVGLLSFWFCVLAACFRSADDEAGFPFCRRHRGYWLRRAWFIVGGWLMGLVLFVLIGIEGSAAAGDKPKDPGLVAFVFAIWVLGFLPTFLIVQLRAVRPVGNERKAVQLARVSRKFAAAIGEDDDDEDEDDDDDDEDDIVDIDDEDEEDDDEPPRRMRRTRGPYRDE